MGKSKSPRIAVQRPLKRLSTSKSIKVESIRNASGISLIIELNVSPSGYLRGAIKLKESKDALIFKVSSDAIVTFRTRVYPFSTDSPKGINTKES